MLNYSPATLLLLTGLLVGCQTHSNSESKKALQLTGGEKLLAEEPVNLWRGAEAVGGVIKITNRRLFFEPHSFNVQKSPEEIPLNQIVEIEPLDYRGHWTKLASKTGMFVKLESGTEYRFVVRDREKLIEFLKVQIQHCKESPPDNTTVKASAQAF
jgi:hypothetical protein